MDPLTQALAQGQAQTDPEEYYKNTPLMRAVWQQNLGAWLGQGIPRAVDAVSQLEDSAPWNNPNLAQAIIGTLKLPAQGVMAAGRGINDYIGKTIANRDEKGITDLALAVAGAGFTGAKALGGVPRGAVLGQNVWHGGPNRWMPEPGFPQGRPRLDRVGTGEGAQAYGHGFYAADSKLVGREYQKMRTNVEVSGTQPDWDNPLHIAALKVDDFGGDRVAAAAELRRNMNARTMPEENKGLVQAAIDLVEGGAELPDAKRIGGHLKKLDLPDEDIAKMLDWDAPLSEQPKVAKLINEIGDFQLAQRGTPSIVKKDVANMTGEDAYKVLADLYGKPAASEALRKAGIPGLKYYDQMSRGKAGAYSDPSGKYHGKVGGVKTLNPDQIKPLSQGEINTATSQMKNSGLTPEEWARKVDTSEPVDVSIFSDGEIKLSDGHHRYLAAKILGKPLNVNLTSINAKNDVLNALVDPRTRNYVTWDQDVLDRTKILGKGGASLAQALANK
jgi:hypothetical protein